MQSRTIVAQKSSQNPFATFLGLQMAQVRNYFVHHHSPDIERKDALRCSNAGYAHHNGGWKGGLTPSVYLNEIFIDFSAPSGCVITLNLG